MNEFEIAKADLLAELEEAKALDTTADIEQKVADYRAELEAHASEDKQAIIDEKNRDIQAIDRLILKAKIKAEALAEAEALAKLEVEPTAPIETLAENIEGKE